MVTHAISREIQPGLVPILKTVVEEELVDTEVTEMSLLACISPGLIQYSPGVISHLVDTRVREVSENIGKVEACHGQFGDDHFRES